MADTRRGPWTVHTSTEVFRNPWISLTDHTVRQPDGSPGQYGVVSFANIAVGVLPIDQDGHVHLVGQHRFPSNTYSWELPEGGSPIGADPLDGAKRELAEETGFSATNWAPLASFDLSNSVTDERSECFLAWDLQAGEASPEPSEDLEIARVPFAVLHERVLAGDIRDSLTIIMTLTAHTKAMRGALPDAVARLILAK